MISLWGVIYLTFVYNSFMAQKDDFLVLHFILHIPCTFFDLLNIYLFFVFKAFQVSLFLFLSNFQVVVVEFRFRVWYSFCEHTWSFLLQNPMEDTLLISLEVKLYIVAFKLIFWFIFSIERWLDIWLHLLNRLST